jgi:hypothetical protein
MSSCADSKRFVGFHGDRIALLTSRTLALNWLRRILVNVHRQSLSDLIEMFLECVRGVLI